MRRIIGTIAAMAIVAFMATSAGSALAHSHNEASRLLPDLSYDNTDIFASTALGGAKSFVGPADDAFSVDLGAVFDGINIDKPGRPMIGLGNQGGGQDDVSGFNGLDFDWVADWFGDFDAGDQLDA